MGSAYLLCAFKCGVSAACTALVCRASMVLALDATRPDLWRSMHCSQCRPVKRDFLVVLPAGPDFDASKWMGRPQHANCDLGGRSWVWKAWQGADLSLQSGTG